MLTRYRYCVGHLLELISGRQVSETSSILCSNSGGSLLRDGQNTENGRRDISPASVAVDSSSVDPYTQSLMLELEIMPSNCSQVQGPES